MKIRFLGGVGEVTGSAHLLITENGRLLRDCGLFQGRREEAQNKNRSVWSRSGGVDAVVVSHAHLDHCGNVPTIVKEGYRGSVYATAGTADLLPLMWEDSARIQEFDVKFLTKRGVILPPSLQPLYTTEDVQIAEKLIVPCPYGKGIQPLRGVEVVFTEAGHILGSALTKITVREGSEKKRIGFAFDLGRRNLPVIRDPEYLKGLDVLVIESTYGAREHEKIEDLEGRLAALVNKTVERGGKIVIPSFALGRTQEVLFSLHRLLRKGGIPKMPVFVDSPLATRVTAVFRKHAELFDAAARKEGMSFLEQGEVRFTLSKEESQSINDFAGPCIIIAASGMCEGGRVLHHLMQTIEDPKNTILFVGFQAGYTLGKKILDGVERVRIYDGTFTVRAEVAKLNAYSAHADKNDLLDFIRHAGPLKHLVLVHGEGLQLQSLADAAPSVTDAKIHIPQFGDELEF